MANFSFQERESFPQKLLHTPYPLSKGEWSNSSPFREGVGGVQHTTH